MKALDDKNDTLVRFSLENAIDDEELYEYEVINDEGERIVKNSKINAYKQRLELYSEYMEQFTEYIDKEGVLV